MGTEFGGLGALEMGSVGEIVTAHGDSPSKLTVRAFTGKNDDLEDQDLAPQNYMLLEGNVESLRFLAELILAQVSSDSACTLHLHPNGAGSAHFADASTDGIIIRRLPCDYHPEQVIR